MIVTNSFKRNLNLHAQLISFSSYLLTKFIFWWLRESNIGDFNRSQNLRRFSWYKPMWTIIRDLSCYGLLNIFRLGT